MISSSDMFILARAVVYGTLFVGLLLIFLPTQILSSSGISQPPSIGAWQIAGMLLGTAGAALAVACVLTFAWVGKGTPAPFDPPRRLVVSGPYRLLRNPMYAGAGLALAGATLYYQSIALLGYGAVFIVATHVFVVLYEEPTLRRSFGPEYEAYCQRTNRWQPGRLRAVVRAVVAVWAGASMGCADLGYRDDVLWRLPSPDGQVLAVCQEVPAFDGPGYAIRLERPDGSLVRPLYRIGDGDPCSEMAWSPDGRILAVLSGHVARIRFVDVAWALAHPDITTASWSWRQVDFGSEQGPLNGAALRFVGPLHVELQLCPAQRQTPTSWPTGRRSCGPDATMRRFDVPLPIVTGHEPSAADASLRRAPCFSTI